MFSVSVSIWFLLPALFLIGNRQNALFVLGHDGGHHLICKNRHLNDFLANLVLWPFGLGISGYRPFHLAHHRNLNQPNDPELYLKEQVKPIYEFPFRLRFLFTSFFGSALREIYFFVKYVYPKCSIKDKSITILLWFFLLTWMYLTNTLWIAGMWFLAASTFMAGFFRFMVWTEHTSTETTHRLRAGWFARTLAFPHNVYLHWEHHYSPGTPFWALPDLNIPGKTITIPELIKLSFGSTQKRLKSIFV